MSDAGLHIHKLNTQARTLEATCFRHKDERPSLSISRQKNLFYCFSAGCKTGGDLINFIEYYYNFDFTDAIAFLVNKYKIDVSDLVVEQTPEEKECWRLAKINLVLSEYLHTKLKTAKVALNFLLRKGISEITLKRFLIGYSPSVSATLSAVRRLGINAQDISTLQLNRATLFNNTIIYPMHNSAGDIMSFYARHLDQRGTKYIGMSNDHPMVGKIVPYGLHMSRQKTRENQGQLIVVEGHNDVLTLHSHNITNTVGVAGGAPTKHHYEIFKSLKLDDVRMCPDGDTGGENAIKAIIEHRTVHQEIRIILLPKGYDPDEYVNKYGTEKFQQLVDDARYPVEMIINDVAEKYSNKNLNTTEKIDLSKHAIQYLTNVSTIERDIAVTQLSDITGLSLNIIEDSISEYGGFSLNDNDLECRILAECTQDKATMLYGLSILGVEDFSSRKHQKIWNAIKMMIDRNLLPHSRHMLITMAISDGLMTEAESKQTPEIGLAGVGMEFAFKKLKELANRRRISTSAKRLVTEIESKKNDLTDVVDTHLRSIANTNTQKYSIVTASDQSRSAMDVVLERIGNPGYPGYDIGKPWAKLMHATLGMRTGHMWTLAGVTKAGKTAMAQNIALKFMEKHDAGVLWINLEMSSNDLALRNISIMTGIRHDMLVTGNLSPADRGKVENAFAQYSNYDMYVASMAGANIYDISNEIRRHVYTHNVKLVFLDYLQLVGTMGGRRDLWEGQMEVVSNLRNLISQLNICGVIISQLNRGAYESSDSGGQHISGTIRLIQDTDLFMAIRNKRVNEMKERPSSNSLLMIEYNRHGPGDLAIDLKFEKECLRIGED